MAEHQEFPLEELKTSLKNIQSSLEQAESDFSDDKELNQSIQETQDAATTAITSLESQRD